MLDDLFLSGEDAKASRRAPVAVPHCVVHGWPWSFFFVLPLSAGKRCGTI